MKHKRIYSIILLSIFVLVTILPLHTALADCDTGEAEIRRQLTNLRQQLADAEKELQRLKNDGYSKAIAEKQKVMIPAGVAIGTGTAIVGTLATGGTLTGPIVLTGIVTGATGGWIGGIIYGFFSHKRALELAEGKVTNIEAAIDAKEIELANCILEQSQNAITPTGYSVSIRYSPTHSVDISTNDPIRRIHMYITPAEASNSGDSITTVVEKDGGFSDQISHTFTPDNAKGKYNVEISVEFYGAEGKVLYRAYPIYVND